MIMINHDTSQNKKRIVGTGFTGLVGSRIVELLEDQYEFVPLGIDVRVKEEIQQKVSQLKPDYMLHLAAKTDVDGCEKEKYLGEKSDAWQINVQGTQNIVDACIQNNVKMVFVSTDFVFSGDTPHGESDIPNPLNFYGKTKLEAERYVQTLGNNGLIIRISFPFRAYFNKREDIVRMFISSLRQGKTVKAVKDQIITPTFIDDIATAIPTIIERQVDGILHLSGGVPISPYELAIMIKNEFNLSGTVDPVEFKDFYKGRAMRPLKSILSNGTITTLGLKTHTIEEALKEIKEKQS